MCEVNVRPSGRVPPRPWLDLAWPLACRFNGAEASRRL